MTEDAHPESPNAAQLEWQQGINSLVERVGSLWSADRVIQALGLDDHGALEQAVADGAVLGLQTSDGVLVYPVWQFHRTADGVAVLPGLLPVISALHEHISWSLATWIRMPSPEIGGRTVLEVATDDPDNEALRSLVQQFNRELSAGSYPRHSDVEAALAGRASYDKLDPVKQALVRAEWSRRLEIARTQLDLEATFETDGRSWSEIDEDGQVVQRRPSADDDSHE
jgi:hypothetical protein